MTGVLTPPRIDTAVSEGDRPRRGLLHSDAVRVLLLVLAWQAVLTIAGALIQSALSKHAMPSVVTHTGNWDGGWFQRVLNGEYATNKAAPAFYPLFPFAVLLVQWASFGALPTLWAGLLVNTAATWLGVLALLGIGRHLLGGRLAPWLLVALYLAAPPAFFLHEFYSEAIFIALAFWAYLFALRRQWVYMGLCLIPLTAARITAILFVGLCFLEFWRSRDWKVRGLLSWQVLWFPASALGWLGYATWLSIVAGDPLAMAKAYRATNEWAYHVFEPNILLTLVRQSHQAWRLLSGQAAWGQYDLPNTILPLVGLALLVLASCYLVRALRGPGLPLALFGAASLVMFTLNSNLVSVYRYLLPCLGLYLAVAVFVRRKPSWSALLIPLFALSLGVQATMMTLFTVLKWAG
ncbi:hypothetical protein [Kutzneria albida]|uniref:Integral membrane protein n=1 Tax=Kutzneria albida DSM 43870 TaxID=1449976 RepID=W5WCH7_9PSEU|nr:hypothetical protein [Kutzneria albida]AHH98460.1 hypothetical protein KALB_5098 [Kutzneria albida DSM 43870]